MGGEIGSLHSHDRGQPGPGFSDGRS
jgi:hypothetical protein